MELKFDFISLITFVCIVQGFFFATTISLLKKGNKKANRILSILIISIAMSISYGVIHYTNLFYALPHLIAIGPSFMLMLGPLMLFYFRALTIKDYRLKPLDLLHFLPMIAFIIFQSPVYFVSAAGKVAWLESTQTIPSNGIMKSFFILLTTNLHVWIYIVINIKLIKEQEKKVKEIHSSLGKKTFVWIKSFYYSYVLVFFLFLVLLVIKFTGSSIPVDRIMPMMVSLCLIYLGITGFRQPSVFIEHLDKNKKKYHKSNFTPEELINYFNKLEELMIKSKPYLEPEISLPILSVQMGLSPQYLSQVINTQAKCNFYDYINKYRVREVQTLLQNDNYRDLNIITVAFEAGFNSKATFNAAFKKHTNKTPSQFKKELS